MIYLLSVVLPLPKYSAVVAQVIGRIYSGPGPASASVNEGTVVLFECNYTAGDIIPTWIINDVPYQLTELPKGHWVNASGLVVLATTDGDVNTTTTYQCRIDVFFSKRGYFTDTSEVATLKVFNTGKLVSQLMSTSAWSTCIYIN